MLLLAVLSVLVAAVSANIQYPLFKQCNASWGNDEMGVPGLRGRVSMVLMFWCLCNFGIINNNAAIECETALNDPSIRTR